MRSRSCYGSFPVIAAEEHCVFQDRDDAGRKLAAALRQARLGLAPGECVVFALPRGGVPVAAPVADALGAPLDLLLVRKIGAPGNPELALGAVSDGADKQVIVNRDIAGAFGFDEKAVAAIAGRQMARLEEQRRIFLGDRAPEAVAGKTAILVDDGAATGATIRLGVRLLRQRGAGRVVVALPVAPHGVARRLREEADIVVCLEEPDDFTAVGAHYLDFGQVEDAEVCRIMEQRER
jgi:putative phosphoribosyl transferase